MIGLNLKKGKNEKLLNKINENGKLFLSHTKLSSKYVIRISISGLRTFENHVNSAKELIQEKLQEIILIREN